MTTTKYFPGSCTTSFFVSLSLYVVSSLARHHPRDLRGCECTLDYIFLWFPKAGALCCLFPAHLNAAQILLPLFPNPLPEGDLVPLTKIFAN